MKLEYTRIAIMVAAITGVSHLFLVYGEQIDALLPRQLPGVSQLLGFVFLHVLWVAMIIVGLSKIFYAPLLILQVLLPQAIIPLDWRIDPFSATGTFFEISFAKWFGVSLFYIVICFCADYISSYRESRRVEPS